jgi:hypothetical protein
VVPQLTLYTHAEFAILLQPSLSQSPHHFQRAAFIPVLIGISLTSLIAALGFSGAALGHCFSLSQHLGYQLAASIKTSSAPSHLL